MHIESVTLTNFRCFGPEPTVITLGSEITALIGANGAGKSAFIEALRRLFGATRAERTLTRSDIYFSPEETPNEVGTRQVIIDVVFALPELDESDEDNAIRTVPEVFKVMTSSGPGDPLRVRMRLEAEWTHGESYIDDIETRVYWISHLNDVAFGEEGGGHLDKQRVQPSDRSKIQLFYVPATRDSSAVTRQALRQILNRLERSGDFGDDKEADIQAISQNLQSKVDELDAVKWVTDNLEKNWARLHEGMHMRKPRLAVLSQEFSQIIRSLTAKVGPAPEGREKGIEELSEGQTSLFFLALSATLAQLETEIANGAPPKGFSDLESSPAALTVYAIEEPENHLAPFYISRLMTVLAGLCKGVQAMGIVTSHSPAILRRVPPESIRHFRLEADACVSRVNGIAFNAEMDTEKFVRQAVHSQPEIYFAKLVILGEGDSEDIVIPRIAKALGVDLDPSFVSFAPLGGRHVNHFWRLLDCLKIPFLTLLDFDLGRHGAGPLRLKYAYNQLSALEDIEVPDWVTGDPDTAHYWKTRKQVDIRRWRRWMADRNIHFSYPLDLDMMMVRAFPDAYEVRETGDPEDLDKLGASIFGKGDGMKAYEETAPKVDHPTDLELAEYDYWFKKRSKPTSHIQALAKLTDEEIVANCPEPLHLLIKQASEILNRRQPDNLDGLL